MSEIERAIEKKEYIERGALLKAFGCENAVKYGNKGAKQQHNSYSSMMLYEIADEINDSPAADVAEVVRGEWEINGYCSECRGRAPFWPMASTYYKSNYCPNCGAKMDGEKEGV